MAASADFLNSSHLSIEELKQLATQMALACAIADGQEIFTKQVYLPPFIQLVVFIYFIFILAILQEVVRMFPDLRPFIYRDLDKIRDPEYLTALNKMRDMLTQSMEVFLQLSLSL